MYARALYIDVQSMHAQACHVCTHICTDTYTHDVHLGTYTHDVHICTHDVHLVEGKVRARAPCVARNRAVILFQHHFARNRSHFSVAIDDHCTRNTPCSNVTCEFEALGEHLRVMNTHMHRATTLTAAFHVINRHPKLALHLCVCHTQTHTQTNAHMHASALTHRQP
jgi:hypothetical protein